MENVNPDNHDFTEVSKERARADTDKRKWHSEVPFTDTIGSRNKHSRITANTSVEGKTAQQPEGNTGKYAWRDSTTAWGRHAEGVDPWDFLLWPQQMWHSVNLQFQMS